MVYRNLLRDACWFLIRNRHLNYEHLEYFRWQETKDKSNKLALNSFSFQKILLYHPVLLPNWQMAAHHSFISWLTLYVKFQLPMWLHFVSLVF